MQGLLEESLHHCEGKLNLLQAAQNMTTINDAITKSVKCFTCVKENIKQNNSGTSSICFHLQVGLLENFDQSHGACLCFAYASYY